jgi:lipoprotein signal peptidase
LNGNLLTQTIVSGLLASAIIVVFLLRFAPRHPRWPQIAAAAIFLDQISKWIVADLVRDGASHSYLGGTIEVGYFTNYLQGFGGTASWLLCATLVGVIAGIRLFQMLVERRYVMSGVTEAGLALVLGGVVAIAVERAWAGFVVDFLQIGPHSGYVYNFADFMALGGVLTLFVRGVAVLPGIVEREFAGADAGAGTER